MNLSSYITKQAGYAKKSIMELSKHPNFFNIKRPFIGESTVNLDWYFEQVHNPSHKLDIEYANVQMKNRRLLFSATNAQNLTPSFFEPKKDGWLETLKASSALPFLYKQGVKIGDAWYVDGGVSSPIPIQEAYTQGAKTVVTIRTVPSDYEAKTRWAHKLKSWVCNKNKCPKILDVITEHENSYENALSFIKTPPSDLKVFEISPPKPLASKLLGSSFASLKADYEMGFEAGVEFIKNSSCELFNN
jgi:predicted patatin/cPLA2 family phospholipase